MWRSLVEHSPPRSTSSRRAWYEIYINTADEEEDKYHLAHAESRDYVTNTLRQAHPVAWAPKIFSDFMITHVHNVNEFYFSCISAFLFVILYGLLIE